MSMAELFQSGRFVDLALLILAAEAVWLMSSRSGTGRDGLLATLASGAALLVALRLALDAAAWPWIAMALSVALLAHLADLRLRFARADYHSGNTPKTKPLPGESM